jgi:non-specific serine/threonine protein kinase
VIGTTVSHYRIVSEIGRGGMGVVYQATDTRLQRSVALKFLPDDVARDHAAVDRFRREARSASALDHANICTVHDVGEHDGRPFIVMQLLEGQTLKQRLREPMAVAEALHIGAQVASALAAAHAKGIIHRDIKPANIFLTSQGVAKVLDFGLAKLAADHPRASAGSDGTTIDAGAADLTQPGTTVGTIGYMSPEQARQEPLDARTDLFSLGAVLYEMTTGRQAFRGDTAAVLFNEILSGQPAPAKSTNPALPAAIEPVLEKALEKDRRLRYQSAADLRADLDRLTRDLSPDGRPAGSRGPARPRWPAVTGMTIAALLVIGIGVWLAIRNPTPGPIDSVAVLPFVNDSKDADAEYLSDGLTDSLINGLSQLPELRVVPRSTAFRFKGDASGPQAIGRTLGVRAVLSGHLAQRGDTLVVTAELVDVARDALLWGDRLERKTTDVLSIQHDISRGVSDWLRVRLTGAQQQRLVKTWTQNSEAYRLYLKGLYHRQKTTEQGFNDSIRYFQQAIDLDPSFPLAYAGLSDSYGSLGYLQIRSSADTWPKAKAAALAALTLDDSLAEAHAALGHAILRYDWDWPAAKASLERALAINPRYGIAHHWYAHYWGAMSDRDLIFEESRRAVDCEPLDLMLNTHMLAVLTSRRTPDEVLAGVRTVQDIEPDFWSAHTFLGMYHLMLKKPDDAIRELRLGAQISNEMPMATYFLGIGYALLGKRREAEQIIVAFERRPYVPTYYIAMIYRQLNDVDKMLVWLERAYRERDGSLIDINRGTESWRTDPRFQDLLKRIGFSPPRQP